jgi:hypothetical protein
MCGGIGGGSVSVSVRLCVHTSVGASGGPAAAEY